MLMLVKFCVTENSKLKAGVERCRLIVTAQMCFGYIINAYPTYSWVGWLTNVCMIFARGYKIAG